MKGVVPIHHQPFQRRMKPGILALFINRQAVLQVIIWQLTSHIYYQSARNRIRLQGSAILPFSK